MPLRQLAARAHRLVKGFNLVNLFPTPG
jgi:hypothetical protein